MALFSIVRKLLQTRTENGIQRLSLRSNFAWILSGNVTYAICQWGGIVALTRLGSSFMLGQFSLGLAIATPVLMFTNLHLRVVQATDARRLYSFTEYFRARAVLTTAGLLVIGGIVSFGHYGRETALVILTVALAKGIETLSDIHYGLFQLNDRLDQSAKSMMFRGFLSVLALSSGLYLGRSVLWGCIALAVVWLAALLVFDLEQGRRFVISCHTSSQTSGQCRIWDLFRVALPLGVATTMAALNLNVPRYFIHARLGERQLGIYSALAYTTVAMIIVSDSLGHSAVPKLARLYYAQHLAEYRSLLFKLLLAGGAVGVIGIMVTELMGGRLLAMVYGSEYAAQYRVFRILIFGTAISCVACIFTSAITAARRFRIQVPLYALVLGANILACKYWLPAEGLTGGATAMLVAAGVHLAIGGAVVVRMLWADRGTSSRLPSSHGQWPIELIPSHGRG